LGVSANVDLPNSKKNPESIQVSPRSVNARMFSQVEFGAPDFVDAVFEFGHRTQFAIVGAVRVLADVAGGSTANSPVSASGIWTLKSAAAGATVASVRTALKMILIRIRVSKTELAF